MATFQFNLVSPEELLYSQAVEQVDVPGTEGDFGVLANHAPLVAMVRPGILTIHREGAPLQVVVGGGFAEVNPEGLTVLADFATPLDRIAYPTHGDVRHERHPFLLIRGQGFVERLPRIGELLEVGSALNKRIRSALHEFDRIALTEGFDCTTLVQLG